MEQDILLLDVHTVQGFLISLMTVVQSPDGSTIGML